ncbi:response regulator [Luteibacter aegosomaticola]|uniref:response regulator n=1 Tax=Luteibacter aegosomaticola TaxID=2911538 RepID=UPI001FF9A006|nr:response regulator [Luteibacter aegosomaticola]UPG88281.1 response regulator [Luteibacter aegosomaticola]
MTNPTDDAPRCLLVEDDPAVSGVFELILEDGGFRVSTIAASEPDAIRAILNTRPDIALLDIDIEGGDSLGVATALLAKDIPVAFVSGHPRTVLPAPFSTFPFVQKPVTRNVLLGLVQALARTRF